MSRTKVEQPVSVPGDRDTIRTSHPAYGQIGASRFHGGAVMYGSDFIHHGGINIRISHSEQIRSLSHDDHHATDLIVEVRMTEAQWATFVSSLNMGAGVPCTLEYLNGRTVADLPDPPSRQKQFAGEMGQDLTECVAKVKRLSKTITEMGLPKGKTAEILTELRQIHGALTDSMPFVAATFDKHMEDTVEKAKQEVQGWMTGALSRAGLAAMAEQLPLALPPASPEGG